MANKQIIILETASGGFPYFRYALWLSVPPERQIFYASSGATSAYKNASAQELAMIQAGSILEIVDTMYLAPGSKTVNAQDALLTRYKEAQVSLTNDNPWNQYGTFYDGNLWTAGSVA